MEEAAHPVSACNNRELSNPAKKKKHNSDAYGINDLPKEILIAILSCLSTKEAVRTSVLTRRWRYLWRFTSSLEFDHGFISVRSAEFRDGVEYQKIATQLGRVVNEVVKLHQGPSIDRFFVRCHGMGHDTKPPTRICNWVRFAMQKDVRDFTLLASNQQFPDLDTFLSISKTLAVKNPPKNHFGGVGVFSSLMSFRLSEVDIQDEMIEYLLSNCPRLEHFFIRRVRTLKNLNVVGSKSLKSLTIAFCTGLKRLTVSAANLVSFVHGASFDKKPVDLQLQDVPLLSDLKLLGQQSGYFLFNPHKHLNYCHQLKKLCLHVPIQDVSCAPTHAHSLFGLPQLQSLKQLELVLQTAPVGNLIFFVSLITACPFLCSYIVKFEYKSKKKMGPVYHARADLTGHHNQYLKEVKLIDFACNEPDLEFALALLQIAKSLEKILIKPGPGCNCRVHTSACTKKMERVVKRVKQLEANLPHGAELVIL